MYVVELENLVDSQYDYVLLLEADPQIGHVSQNTRKSATCQKCKLEVLIQAFLYVKAHLLRAKSA